MMMDRMTASSTPGSTPSTSTPRVAAGREIFQGQAGGCHYCHTASGEGLTSQGAANLTDAIWTVADVPGAASDADRVEAVEAVFGAMKAAMERGERIELRGFGVFQVKPRKKGIGRNPRTGREVRIPPGKTIRFKPGKNLRNLG